MMPVLHLLRRIHKIACLSLGKEKVTPNSPQNHAGVQVTSKETDAGGSLNRRFESQRPRRF